MTSGLRSTLVEPSKLPTTLKFRGLIQILNSSGLSKRASILHTPSNFWFKPPRVSIPLSNMGPTFFNSFPFFFLFPSSPLFLPRIWISTSTRPTAHARWPRAARRPSLTATARPHRPRRRRPPAVSGPARPCAWPFLLDRWRAPEPCTRSAAPRLSCSVATACASTSVTSHCTLGTRTSSAPRSPAQLPQVFADGLHLGGAEEVRRLHKSGELAKALEFCEMAATGGKGGGVRFVPCNGCSDSCKVFVVDDDGSMFKRWGASRARCRGGSGGARGGRRSGETPGMEERFLYPNDREVPQE